MMRPLLLVSLLLAAGPALAAPVTPDLVAQIDDYRWRELPFVQPYMFDYVYAGEDMVYFEEGLLSHVQEKFGGTISENYDHRWLCYDAGELRIRFVGPWLEFDEPSPLEMVTVEKRVGVDASCIEKPEMANIQVNGETPGFGEKLNAVLDRYGSAEIRQESRLGYRRVAVLGDEESWTVLTSVYYRLDGDVIDQVAWRVQRITNPHFGGWARDRYALTSPNPVYLEQTGIFADGVTMSGQTLTLEETPLPAAVTAMGGELHEEGEAGSHVTWSCLVADSTRIWLMADGERGPDTIVTGVALDRSDDFDFSYGCTPAPDGFAVPAIGDVPTLGASVGELERRFGPATEDDRGHIRYFSSTIGEGGTMAATQALDYRIENGKVTGVALSQETGD